MGGSVLCRRTSLFGHSRCPLWFGPRLGSIQWLLGHVLMYEGLSGGVLRCVPWSSLRRSQLDILCQRSAEGGELHRALWPEVGDSQGKLTYLVLVFAYVLWGRCHRWRMPALWLLLVPHVTWQPGEGL